MKKIFLLISFFLFLIPVNSQVLRTNPNYIYHTPVGGGGYSAEYQAVYDAYVTPPPDSIATKFNTFIETIVAGAVWSELDVMYVFATNNTTDALINWKNPGTYNATNVHSTAFATYRGFTSDGVNDYIDLNWNPSTNGANYQETDACVGIYIRTTVSADKVEVGCSDGTNTTMLQAGYPGVGTDFYLRLNSEGYEFVANCAIAGMKIITRIEYNNCLAFNNKTSYIVGEPGDVIPNAEMFALCWNVSGTPTDFSTNQVSLVFAGGALSQAKVDIITDAWEVFMDSNGYGVIP